MWLQFFVIQLILAFQIPKSLYRMIMDDVGMSPSFWDAGLPKNAPKSALGEFYIPTEKSLWVRRKTIPPKIKCLILKINVVNPTVNHPQVITTNGIEPIPQA